MYELTKRKKAYENTFMGDDINVGDKFVSFTAYLEDGNEKNCKNYEAVTEHRQLSATIVADMRFNLDDLEHADMRFNLDDLEHADKMTLTQTSPARCIETQ